MRAHGNGAPRVCVQNLLALFRGEVPFERVKGIDPGIIDTPLGSAEQDIKADAKWLIETYEPRAELERLTVADNDGAAGGFVLLADIKEKEG